MAFDAIVALDGNFNRAVPILGALAKAANEGPYGQAHAISADGSSVFKTSRGWTRYLANNGGAYAESVLITLFGYNPTFLASQLPTPILAGKFRGLTGTLACIRAPGPILNFITAILTDKGVVYQQDEAC